ncbi:MAG: hypothetical protein AAGI38_12620 [Bacteroidota bacterium]
MIIVCRADHLTSTLIQIIQSVPGLADAVNIQPELPEGPWQGIVVEHDGLYLSPDWVESRPPYLIKEPFAFNENYLIGCLCLLWGDWVRAYDLLEEDQFDIQMVWKLMNQEEIDLGPFSGAVQPMDLNDEQETYRWHHNQAILRHYGRLDREVLPGEVEEWYKRASLLAVNPDQRALSVRHHAVYLMDSQKFQQADRLLETTIRENNLSDSASFSLRALQVRNNMNRLSVNLPEEDRLNIKEQLWEVLSWHETHGMSVQLSLDLLDASQVAAFEKSFAESLGYINRAISILGEEEILELQLQAFTRKADLLHQWASNGQTQFYKPAIEAYQAALKLISREMAPYPFAEIHHQLALIYTEMPAPQGKKAMLAGLAVSSFDEALKFFTQETYPVQFAWVCHNYGAAFMKFPTAFQGNNYQRAAHFLRAALEVRTPEKFPHERCLSLLNLLEALWNIPRDNQDPLAVSAQLREMKQLAHEAINLSPVEELRIQAQDHLEKVDQVIQTYQGVHSPQEL